MRTITLALVLVVALISPVSVINSQPITKPTRVLTPAACQTTGGTKLLAPARTVLAPPPFWDDLDIEMKRLQTTEIRLTAENDSLKASLRKRPIPWYYVAGALSLGFSASLVWKAVR